MDAKVQLQEEVSALNQILLNSLLLQNLIKYLSVADIVHLLRTMKLAQHCLSEKVSRLKDIFQELAVFKNCLLDEANLFRNYDVGNNELDKFLDLLQACNPFSKEMSCWFKIKVIEHELALQAETQLDIHQPIDQLLKQAKNNNPVLLFYLAFLYTELLTTEQNADQLFLSVFYFVAWLENIPINSITNNVHKYFYRLCLNDFFEEFNKISKIPDNFFFKKLAELNEFLKFRNNTQEEYELLSNWLKESFNINYNERITETVKGIFADYIQEFFSAINPSIFTFFKNFEVFMHNTDSDLLLKLSSRAIVQELIKTNGDTSIQRDAVELDNEFTHSYTYFLKRVPRLQRLIATGEVLFVKLMNSVVEYGQNHAVQREKIILILEKIAKFETITILQNHLNFEDLIKLYDNQILNYLSGKNNTKIAADLFSKFTSVQELIKEFKHNKFLKSLLETGNADLLLERFSERFWREHPKLFKCISGLLNKTIGFGTYLLKQIDQELLLKYESNKVFDALSDLDKEILNLIVDANLDISRLPELQGFFILLNTNQLLKGLCQLVGFKILLQMYSENAKHKDSESNFLNIFWSLTINFVSKKDDSSSFAKLLAETILICLKDFNINFSTLKKLIEENFISALLNAQEKKILVELSFDEIWQLYNMKIGSSNCFYQLLTLNNKVFLELCNLSRKNKKLDLKQLSNFLQNKIIIEIGTCENAVLLLENYSNVHSLLKLECKTIDYIYANRNFRNLLELLCFNQLTTSLCSALLHWIKTTSAVDESISLVLNKIVTPLISSENTAEILKEFSLKELYQLESRKKDDLSLFEILIHIADVATLTKMIKAHCSVEEAISFYNKNFVKSTSSNYKENPFCAFFVKIHRLFHKDSDHTTELEFKFD